VLGVLEFHAGAEWHVFEVRYVRKHHWVLVKLADFPQNRRAADRAALLNFSFSNCS
jgi:hypothetical protein